MKSVVISGATSMIGLSLIQKYIENNTEVIAIVRKGSKRKSDIPLSPLVKIYECDLSDISHFSIENNKQPEIFFHFAWSNTDKKRRMLAEYQYENIKYTLDSLKIAKKLGCKVFIGSGSQAEYGRVDGRISPKARVFPENSYGVSKYTAGKLGGILAKEIGIDFIWTRIFSAYGVGDMDNTMVMHCIKSLLNGEKPILTKCEQMWDYINSKDVAKAYYLIGEKGVNQSVYNIGSGHVMSLKEYVIAIRDAINPALPLGFGELPYTDLQIMYLCANIDNLKEDTGFSPQIPFVDGIKETIEWYKKKENL